MMRIHSKSLLISNDCIECHVILLDRVKGWLNVLTINPASVLQLCCVLYSLRPFCICDWYLVLEVVLTHPSHSHNALFHPTYFSKKMTCTWFIGRIHMIQFISLGGGLDWNIVKV